MFGLSFIEVIAIGVILLIVVGPKQLPEVARTIARFLNEFKRTTAEFTDSFYNIRNEVSKTVDQARDRLDKELGAAETRDALRQVGREMEKMPESGNTPGAAPSDKPSSVLEEPPTKPEGDSGH